MGRSAIQAMGSESWQLHRAWLCACKTDETCVCSQGKEKEGAARVENFMTMMDSMTNNELNSADSKTWQHNAALKRSNRV